MSLIGWSGGPRLGDRGRSDVSEFRRRFRWIALGMTVLLLGLVARLFQLQVLEADENRAVARENIVRRVTLATTRGLIRDRNGKVLASSRPAYNVYVVPDRLDMAVTWPKLVDYLAIGMEERTRLEQHLVALRADDGPRKSQQILLREDISRDAVAAYKTHEAELPGVEVAAVPVRYYPFDDIGAHVLGYMAEVDAEKLQQLRSSGYAEGDRIGATGVERAWESYLRGTRGWEKVLVDAKGHQRPGGEGIIEDPHRVDPIRAAICASPSTPICRRRSRRPCEASSPAALLSSMSAPAASSASTRSRATIRTPSRAARASRSFATPSGGSTRIR